jgi:hypothetical protein
LRLLDRQAGIEPPQALSPDCSKLLSKLLARKVQNIQLEISSPLLDRFVGDTDQPYD